jgi:hypothetical protein
VIKCSRVEHQLCTVVEHGSDPCLAPDRLYSLGRIWPLGYRAEAKRWALPRDLWEPDHPLVLTGACLDPSLSSVFIAGSRLGGTECFGHARA